MVPYLPPGIDKRGTNKDAAYACQYHQEKVNDFVNHASSFPAAQAIPDNTQ